LIDFLIDSLIPQMIHWFLHWFIDSLIYSFIHWYCYLLQKVIVLQRTYRVRSSSATSTLAIHQDPRCLSSLVCI